MGIADGANADRYLIARPCSEPLLHQHNHAVQEYLALCLDNMHCVFRDMSFNEYPCRSITEARPHPVLRARWSATGQHITRLSVLEYTIIDGAQFTPR